MEINVNDPRELLVEPTPGGGRHYYVFLDGLHHVNQLTAFCQDIGLQLSRGQIEAYPSINQALRLPFGYLPGRTTDPRRWIRFVDDWRSKRIKRHGLGRLSQSFQRWSANQKVGWRSTLAAPRSIDPSPTTAAPRNIAQGKFILPGIPKRFQNPGNTIAATVGETGSSVAKPKSWADAEKLLRDGITQLGTRTAVLNHLAAHLIFTRGLASDAAAMFLTEWAMNPRHVSADIREDLRRGTSKVANQIRSLCTWYAKHRDPKRFANSGSPGPRFTHAEVSHLAVKLSHLDSNSRREVAVPCPVEWDGNRHQRSARSSENGRVVFT
jgi:hypothetical protein